MAEDYKTKSCCVVDSGIFSGLARTLSKSFGKVYYTSPWVSAFPSSRQVEVGEGFAEFDRVNDIWEIVDDVDLFVFPDMFQGPLQEYLEGKGKLVWGSRNGDELENYRAEAKEHFKELDIPQGPYEVVKGIAKLRSYIKSRGEDKLWIKISLTRHDTETFSTEGYDLAKNRLDKMEADLGPVAERMQFVVEDNLPDTIEISIDTFCIDGEYPSIGLLGMEYKDEGYLCAVKDWSAMPPALVDIYEKLSPTLKKYGYRNMFAIECPTMRDKMFISDPCCRAGSPVLELELYMIRNWADILWNGAKGNLVDPEYNGKYGYEVIVESEWVKQNPLLVEVPEEYRDQINLCYATQYGDSTWIMPQGDDSKVGSIVSCGDSLDECFAEVEAIGKTLKGNKIEVFTRSIPKLKKNLEKLREWGIIVA